jgi:hypothetical protein
VVKTGNVVRALGGKLNAGAVFALADGGCQVVVGTRAALVKFGAGPLRNAIRGACGRAGENTGEVMRATRATMNSLLNELKSNVASLFPPGFAWFNSTVAVGEASEVFLRVHRRQAEPQFATAVNEATWAIAVALTKGAEELKPLTLEKDLAKLVINRADVPGGVDLGSLATSSPFDIAVASGCEDVSRYLLRFCNVTPTVGTFRIAFKRGEIGMIRTIWDLIPASAKTREFVVQSWENRRSTTAHSPRCRGS